MKRIPINNADPPLDKLASVLFDAELMLQSVFANNARSNFMQHFSVILLWPLLVPMAIAEAARRFR